MATAYPGAPGESGSTDNLVKLLGIGAYEIDDSSSGSGTSFGQNISADFVHNLITTSALNMGIGGDGSLGSIIANLGTYLGTFDLQMLSMFRPFIPTSTDEDWADVSTAVQTILDAMNLRLLMGGSEFTDWITDIFNPNSALWTQARAWWDTVMAQLAIMPTSAGTTAAQWATWWSTLLVDLGFSPTDAGNIANFLSGNYDAAKQAKLWWDQIFTALGLSSGTSLGSTISGNTTGISTNLTMLNQITDIFNGLVVTPINTAVQHIKDWFTTAWTPLPTTVSGHTTTLSGHTTTLSTHTTSLATQLGWWQRLPENLLITLDGMHIFYPLGSPSDTPTTTVGGKRTWYAAKADMALLQGQANSTTTPTVTFTDPGTVVQANTAAANTAASNAATAIAHSQSVSDAIVTATGGTPVTGSTTTDIKTGLTNIPASNIVGAASANVDFGAVGGGNSNATSVAPKTLTESHTIVAGDGTVYAALAFSCPSTGITWSSAVNYGSTPMTLVKSVTSAAAFSNVVVAEVWKLKAPPSGSQTVSATLTRTSGSGNFQNMCLQSMSYSATKEGTIASASGGGSSPISMSTSSATGKMVLGVFASVVGALSGYTQTQRGGTLAPGNVTMIAGDAPGAASVSFGAALSSASTAQWCGITVELSN